MKEPKNSYGREAREMVNILTIKKKTLAYSTLSDKVYWVDGKGNKHDVTDTFIQVMMLWIIQEDGAPVEKDTRYTRALKNDGKVSFEISLMKKS